MYLFIGSLFPEFLLQTENKNSDRLKTRNLTDWEIKGSFSPFDLSVTFKSQIKYRYSCRNGPPGPITLTVTLISNRIFVTDDVSDHFDHLLLP